MNLIKYLFAAVLMVMLFSCDKENFRYTEEGLLGYWINPVYEESVVTYERANAFENGYGIAFFEDGELLERKNVGWCGTPPITYGDYEGSWTQDEDGLIHVLSQYWGGTQEYTFMLISVDEETLVLELID